MKFKKLLPMMAVLTLGVAALVGCGSGGGGGGEGGLPDDGKQHTLVIKNEDDIKAEWHVGDATRKLELEITDDGAAANVAAQLVAGNLKVSSSDPEVLGAAGVTLTAAKEGTATLTVSYFKVVKTLELTIQKKLTAIDLFGTVHAGTQEDPLDNADGNKVGKWVEDHKAETGKDSTEEEYYISGVVASYYHRPGERTSDSVVSYFLEAKEGDAQFEVYKCLNGKGEGLTDQDIWLGGTALAKGKITFYGKQYETSSATLISCEGGEKPGEQQTIQITVANAIKLMNAAKGDTPAGILNVDGSSTYDKYEFTGYIIYTDGSSFYLGDKADDSIDNLKKLLQIYSPTKEVKELLAGDTGYQMKVKVTAQLKNYHSQLETICAYTVEKLEDGVKWPKIAEPAKLENKTVAEFLADETGNNKVQYVGLQVKVKGYYGTNKDFTKYGNLVVTDLDGENEFTIYGATATGTALAWNEIGGKYIFTNPANFLSNDVTKEIAIGDILKVNLTRCDYTKDDVTSKQGNGIVTKVGLDLPADLKVTKSNSGIGTSNLPEAKQIEYEVESGKIKLEWSKDCFDYGNQDEFGIAKNNGYVKLVSLPEGKKVAKLVIDLFQYENIEVYKTADGSGDKVTGTAGTNSDLNKSKVMEYAIDGTAFYIKNPSTYNQGVYSMTIVLADVA